MSDRNTVETKVEVKNEFRTETKPVITSTATQQSTYVQSNTGKLVIFQSKIGDKYQLRL